MKNSYIKIDQNSFQINEDTVIEDKDGNAWKITELGINDNVRVEGQVQDEKNNATKITVLSRTKGKIEPVKETVKTETTTTTSVKPAPKPQPSPAPQPDPIEEVPQDTFGGAIIETPPTINTFQ